MSWWEFQCCIAGFNRFHAASEPKNPDLTDDEYEALCELGDKWSAENANR